MISGHKSQSGLDTKTDWLTVSRTVLRLRLSKEARRLVLPRTNAWVGSGKARKFPGQNRMWRSWIGIAKGTVRPGFQMASYDLRPVLPDLSKIQQLEVRDATPAIARRTWGKSQNIFQNRRRKGQDWTKHLLNIDLERWSLSKKH
jgi:hypothetical protein